jgi:class 3 adenylate cyclase
VPRPSDWSLLEHEIEAITKFPDQNPNPVLRVSESGVLTYANAAAASIRAAWGVAVGDRLGDSLLGRLGGDAAPAGPTIVEVQHEHRTFEVLSVRVPELGVFNLYGTDVTASRVLEQFPASNPSPVLRITPGGLLRYANDASRPITTALGLEAGRPLPDELLTSLRACLDHPSAPPPEVPGAGGLTYRLTPVRVPEFDVVNVYGQDVTAEKAIDRFPTQNPNPVLRLSRSGRLTFANPASSLVQKALGATVGDLLAPAVFERIVDACENADDPTMEVEADGRLYRLRVVSVYEFDSINLYGTDITAARQVERLNAENEALLLNILPRSIAERLRGGETVIADRFEDMAVLFADVVGFTAMSARLSPNDLVNLLNDVFTRCDQLAEQYKLEKIKTVGDAYMVVGGLQAVHGLEDTGAETHAADVAMMGLALIEEVGRLGRARGLPLEIRVGMHVGPAVAGVIGLKKFIYDVWGDTVNTASRMESTGVPGRLQVTPETRDRLRRAFEFERRGPVEVKGKGIIETWFLVGPRTAGGH